MTSAGAYTRLLGHFAKKDWEIIGFDASSIVLRIERDNIKFDRSKGTILDRHPLGPKKSTG